MANSTFESQSIQLCSGTLTSKFQKLTALQVSQSQLNDKNCISTTSILSMVIAFIGILVNLLNIAVYTKGVSYSPRVRFLLVISILDILLLILQLPQLVIASESGQIMSTHRAAFGGYAILLYSFGFMLTTCYAWMLVAIVIHHWFQTRDNNEMTDVLSNEVNTSNQDKYTSTEFRTCNIAIVIVISLSFCIHFIKLFEFTVNSDLLTPSLLLKRISLQNSSYETYSLIINTFVSFLLPYLFLLVTSIYYLMLKVRMRNASDPPPCGQQLLQWLCVFYVVTHCLSLYTRFAPLSVKSYRPFVSCIAKVDEMFNITFLASKVVLYLVFYEVYNYCLKQRLDLGKSINFSSGNSFAIRLRMTSRDHNGEMAPDTSFVNPIYGAATDEQLTGQSQL